MRKWLGIFLLFVIATVRYNAGAQNALLISELLFQPYSGEAEYVELYNNGHAAVDLANYHIVRWVGDSLGTHYALPSYSLGPHEYVALTKDASSVAANYDVKYPSKLLECNLPTYPNSGGSVIVTTADSVISDRFDYAPSMHSRLLRNKAGVALERRSFDRPAVEASNWFSASSVSGYGTPGYENSQSTEWLVEETAFTFSSTLLSPDGDGYQDELEISYLMEDGGLSARAEVYDGRGRMVRRLLNNALLGTHGTIVWAGRDNNNQVLPQGQYIVQITLVGLDGTRQTIKRTIALIIY